MKHLLSILFAAVLVFGNGVSIQAQEPDRIVTSLTVAGIAPGDQPVYLSAGPIDVVVDTTLTCYPPDGKAGCGVIVAAMLHAPTDGEFPIYPDVIDVTSSVPCGDGYAPGCQAPAGLSQFTYTFDAPRPGTYVLEVWSIVGMDYPSPDVRLTTNYLSTHEGSVYAEGVVYVIKGWTEIVVTEARGI